MPSHEPHRKAAALWPLFLIPALLWTFLIPLPTLPADRWSHFHPDEANQLAVIDYVAAHGALPPFNARYYMTSHPPVYHLLAGALYAAAKPLMGWTATVLLLRLVSVALGAATVWLTYRTARLLADGETAWLAAVVVAGVPMFVSLSSAVSNENLAAFAATATFALLVAGLRDGFGARRLALLAVWLALGVGSKLTCLGLIPAAAVALWAASGREPQPSSRRTVGVGARLLLVLLPTLLVMIPWLAQNALHYGDPLKQAAVNRLWGEVQPGFAALAADRGVPAPYYLASLAKRGWMSFWGVFDGLRRPLPSAVYGPLALVQVAVLAGLIVAGVQSRRGDATGATDLRRVAAFATASTALVVVAIYFRYNWQHYTPQGRYFFPLLLPFGLLFSVGWRALFAPAGRGVASCALAAGLFALNLYAVASMTSHRLPFP